MTRSRMFGLKIVAAQNDVLGLDVPMIIQMTADEVIE
jgi:hypothetical protein